MAIPNLLISSAFQATLQVAELVGGGTINQIGANVRANSDATNTDDIKAVSNYVVEYRGKIYSVTADSGNNLRIDAYDPGLGTWSNVHSQGATEPLGIWVVNTGTAQRIFAVGVDFTTGRQRISYSDDGSSWSSLVGTATWGSATGARGGKSILFNNKLYLLGANTSTPYCTEIDPVALTTTAITPGWPASSVDNSDNGCFIVYDDRLFCAHQAGNANPSNLNLYEFTGGGWSFNVTVTSLYYANGAPEEGCSAAFSDPATGDLILFTNGTNASFQRGTFAYRLTPSGSSFTVADITTTVVPSGLRPGVRGAVDAAVEDRWFVYVSTDTPGSTEVYLFVAEGSAPGSGYSVYQWVSVAAEASFVTAGPSTVYAIPEAVLGGGERIYRAVGNQCMIESAQAVLGGYEISYRVYGTQSGQNVTLWYSREQEVPDQQATISAQTGGSGITGGNTVTGITGDDGATLFTLRWDIAADGVPSGDAVHMLLDIQVP